jgi:hypothetical protein
MPTRGRIFAARAVHGDGHQVSYEAGDSRRTVHLPASSGEERPVAAESFAFDADSYHALLQRVEALAKKGV